jgi:hypothetical protein
MSTAWRFPPRESEHIGDASEDRVRAPSARKHASPRMCGPGAAVATRDGHEMDPAIPGVMGELLVPEEIRDAGQPETRTKIALGS